LPPRAQQRADKLLDQHIKWLFGEPVCWDEINLICCTRATVEA
jgi:hypothetical protein